MNGGAANALNPPRRWPKTALTARRTVGTVLHEPRSNISEDVVRRLARPAGVACQGTWRLWCVECCRPLLPTRTVDAPRRRARRGQGTDPRRLLPVLRGA